jgi:hypothetical protein
MPINPLSVPNFGGPFSGGADFAPLGNLGNVYQAQQDRQRQLAALGQLGTDPTQNAMALIKSNDPRLAQQGIELMQNITRQKYLESQQAESQREFALTNKLAQEKEARAQRAEDYDSEEGRTNRLVEAQKTNPNLPGPNSPEGQYFIHSGNWPDPTKQNKVLTEQGQRDERYADFKRRFPDRPEEEAQTYALTNKLPGEELPPKQQTRYDKLTDESRQAQAALDNIKQAKELSKSAWGFRGAGPTSLGVLTVLGANAPTSAVDTQDLLNATNTNIARVGRTMFPTRITNMDLNLLKDIEGSVNQPDVVRQKVFTRAEKAFQRIIDENEKEQSEIKGGTRYRKTTGETPPTPAPKETPAPKPTEAPKISASDVSIEDIMREKARRRQAGNK